jgi:hypothetical protein
MCSGWRMHHAAAIRTVGKSRSARARRTRVGAKLLIRKTERGIVHEDTDCVFGEVSPAHLEKARKKDPPPPWIDDAPAAVGHPDSGDIKLLAEKIQASFPGDSML